MPDDLEHNNSSYDLLDFVLTIYKKRKIFLTASGICIFFSFLFLTIIFKNDYLFGKINSLKERFSTPKETTLIENFTPSHYVDIYDDVVSFYWYFYIRHLVNTDGQTHDQIGFEALDSFAARLPNPEILEHQKVRSFIRPSWNQIPPNRVYIFESEAHAKLATREYQKLILDHNKQIELRLELSRKSNFAQCANYISSNSGIPSSDTICNEYAFLVNSIIFRLNTAMLKSNLMTASDYIMYSANFNPLGIGYVDSGALSGTFIEQKYKESITPAVQAPDPNAKRNLFIKLAIAVCFLSLIFAIAVVSIVEYWDSNKHRIKQKFAQ